MEGLNCANCSEKIRAKLETNDIVENAEVNFIKSELKLRLISNTGELNSNDVLNLVQSVTDSIEDGIKVVELKENQNLKMEQNQKFYGKSKEIIFMSISFILLIGGVLSPDSTWLKLLFFVPSYLLVGYKTLLIAGKNILRGKVFDENFLMSIASLGAFAIGEYAEAVAVMLFYQIGETFQDIAVDKSRRSIKSLLDIKPDFARIIIENGVQEVKPELVNIGDIIEIRVGERFPLDGEIIEGNTTVDTSALTGESVPRDVQIGDNVLSGFINTSSVVHIQVTKKFSESTTVKLLELVENSVAKKAKTENFITKFAKYYTPIVVISAVILALIPPVFFAQDFNAWLERGLMFLVVSCPCALVVSVPLSYFAGIGRASRKGILIKGSNYLEALTSISTVVFDKTGTLTEGIFKVTEINAIGNNSENLLKLSAHAESLSTHPIAKSIVRAHIEKGGTIDSTIIKNHKEITGKGISVEIEGNTVLIGKSNLLKGIIDLPESEETCVYVAENGIYKGYIKIADTEKANSKTAIEKLKRMGINQAIMLTGDNKQVAGKIASRIGIDKFHAELMPKDKVGLLEALKEKLPKGESIAFVGDGINDSPVIARADIGFAMGALGSDSAIESADIVLMNDDPEQIPQAISIARQTKQIVLQNIIFALAVKFMVQITSAFGLTDMWFAVFADVGVTFIAVLNAMRLLRKK